MALGGGTFASQNKILAGTYINFVSASKATATVGDRGYAAMALELDWGPEGTIIEVTNGDFQKNSMTLFGYDYADEKMKGLRDLVCQCKDSVYLQTEWWRCQGIQHLCDCKAQRYQRQRSESCDSGKRGGNLKL